MDGRIFNYSAQQKRKALVFGGKGYIGSQFLNTLQKSGFECLSPSVKELNILNEPDKLFKFIETHRSELKFVINCAGYVGIPNVDACELHKTETYTGNVLLPVVLAMACEKYDLELLHVSSGCIYSGHKIIDGKIKGYTEEDEPNFSFDSPPCSFYSGTKAEGEKKLLPFKNVYVARLRIPFDKFDNPRNYLTKVQKYDKLLDDTNSISHREEFVKACVYILNNKEALPGIYNITNTGHVTTKEVAVLVKHGLKLNKSFSFFKNAEEFYGEAASTPRSNCVMDNSKLLSIGFKMRPATDAIIASLKEWKKE